MRLWHYKLIPVLPKKQLVSQWRECIAIKGMWEKGKLANQPLVNYVMDYSKIYFFSYVRLVIGELERRKIKFNSKYYHEIFDFCEEDITIDNVLQIFIFDEHNERYLEQCYYNLQEKYDRGMITKEEWSKILDKVWR